ELVVPIKKRGGTAAEDLDAADPLLITDEPLAERVGRRRGVGQPEGAHVLGAHGARERGELHVRGDSRGEALEGPSGELRAGTIPDEARGLLVEGPEGGLLRRTIEVGKN